MNINYTGAIIFTKVTSLSSFFEGKYGSEFGSGSTSLGFNQLKYSYSKDRTVQLILLFRHAVGDDNRCHTYCKIKCPVNPLPIKGEFEVVSLSTMVHHLNKEGWEVKQRLPISLLK